ncbi:MAG: hypothetical protein D6690_07715 [Nitrospirae bacterium]|nr:MAG: hypothetical protein D6690_07715 [Nitrospirota bacterium]
MKSIIRHSITIALIATISLIGQAYGQTVAYTQQVVSQLDRAKAFARERGFQLTHDYHIDQLPTREAGRIVLELQGGVTYTIVGACDNDCRDLDMVLVDENGNIVSEDMQDDDLPVLTVTPRWTGKFMIGVRISMCRQSPCVYGLAVFGKESARRPASQPWYRQNGIPTGPIG